MGGQRALCPLPTGLYVLVGAGALMMAVGFFGCCGAMRESQCVLGSVSAARGSRGRGGGGRGRAERGRAPGLPRQLLPRAASHGDLGSHSLCRSLSSSVSGLRIVLSLSLPHVQSMAGKVFGEERGLVTARAIIIVL